MSAPRATPGGMTDEPLKITPVMMQPRGSFPVHSTDDPGVGTTRRVLAGRVALRLALARLAAAERRGRQRYGN